MCEIVVKRILAAVLAVLLWLGCTFIWSLPFDDSDAPPIRSGMAIKTDHLTGCQYLTTFLGAITPRLDSAGKQVCHPALSRNVP
jgi:hypothetical protein